MILLNLTAVQNSNSPKVEVAITENVKVEIIRSTGIQGLVTINETKK